METKIPVDERKVIGRQLKGRQIGAGAEVRKLFQTLPIGAKRSAGKIDDALRAKLSGLNLFVADELA